VPMIAVIYRTEREARPPYNGLLGSRYGGLPP
jgi:hypothetical protein